MLKKAKICSNPYFIIPFILWVAAGAVLLLCYSRHYLFFAINTANTHAMDVAMYYITFLGQGEVIVPALLLLMLLPKYRNRWYFFTAILCNLLPFFIQQGLKTFFDHPRPRLLYYYDVSHMHFLPDWPVLLHRGFPSGHSQGAFSFFCFLTLLLPARYNKLGVLFFLLALSVCYSRIYLTAHFFEDVYVGSILGAGLTIIIYTLMENYKSLFYKRDTFI